MNIHELKSQIEAEIRWIDLQLEPNCVERFNFVVTSEDLSYQVKTNEEDKIAIRSLYPSQFEKEDAEEIAKNFEVYRDDERIKFVVMSRRKYLETVKSEKVELLKCL